MELLSFEKDLEIDKDSLDEAWLKQARLYFNYARMAEEASNDLAKAKDDLEIIHAQIDTVVRRDAADSGEKMTDKIAESKVLESKAYQRALEAYNKDKHDHGILLAAVRTLDHKKSALENLVKLYVGGYYAAPTEPKEKKTSIKEDKFDAVQNIKLNKKRG